MKTNDNKLSMYVLSTCHVNIVECCTIQNICNLWWMYVTTNLLPYFFIDLSIIFVCTSWLLYYVWLIANVLYIYLHKWWRRPGWIDKWKYILYIFCQYTAFIYLHLTKTHIISPGRDNLLMKLYWRVEYTGSLIGKKQYLYH